MTTERTITTQDELNAALLDETVETIHIDSPAGVVINIGDTGRVFVSVDGKSTVGTVSGRVGRVTGSGRVEWVTGSGRVGEVTGSGRVGEVTGSGRVEWVTGSGRVEWVTGSGRVGEVTDSGRVGRVTGSGRVEWVTGSGRVGEVTDSGRVGEVTDSGRVGRVTGSGSVEWVTDSGRVEWVTDSGRVGRVTGSGSVGEVTGTAVIHAVHGNATVNAGPYVAVYLYSATATITGGVLIDLTQLDKLSPQEWCDHHGINAGRLQADLEYITAHPEEWNQGVWASRTACGTTACLAGTTVLREGIKLAWKLDGSADFTEDGASIRLEARRLLGLSNEDAGRLFEGSSSLRGLWEIASDITHGLIQIPADLAD